MRSSTNCATARPQPSSSSRRRRRASDFPSAWPASPRDMTSCPERGAPGARRSIAPPVGDSSDDVPAEAPCGRSDASGATGKPPTRTEMKRAAGTFECRCRRKTGATRPASASDGPRQTAHVGLSGAGKPDGAHAMNPAVTSLIDRAGLDTAKLRHLVGRALEGADDGELFVEYRQSEALVFDNGRLKQATYDTTQGFGLRAVKEEAVGYAHASDLSEGALARAVEAVRAVKSGHSGIYAEPPGRTNRKLYDDDNPLGDPAFGAKVKLLEAIDAYARGKDSRVRQVTASTAASWQVVEILRADGETYRDIRPLVRINVSVVVGEGDRQETGAYGFGGREGYQRFVTPQAWQGAVDEAVRQALVNLEAVPAPAGEMDVVLGPGWPGVMLHEAVGHGLEGDFNRKKTSAFAGLLGQQVAAKGVTVVDDGTIQGRRGSLSIDDEGTPRGRAVVNKDAIGAVNRQARKNAR